MGRSIRDLILGLVAAAVVLGGCTQEYKLKREAERSIRSAMKDPDAAKVSVKQVDTDLGIVCGQVNGKNSFGAYAGARGFCFRGGVAAVEGEDPAYFQWSSEIVTKRTREIEARVRHRDERAKQPGGIYAGK